MKTIKKTWVLALVVMACSCHKNSPTGKATIISKEVAVTVAKKFNYHLFENRSGARTNSADSGIVTSYSAKAINNVITLYGNKIPAAYIVNYKNNEGYLIVSADKNASAILAYIDKGNFTDTTRSPDGVKEWIETSVKQINYIRANHLAATPTMMNEWNLYSSGAVTYIVAPPAPADPPCDYYTISTFGPYLQSTWDQGCDYNSLCPASSCGPCGHYYTGCVATAMAQVMYYYKWPAGYNWNLMYNDKGSPECARLMKNAGISVNMSYACEGSGAYGNNIPGAMQNNFNYKNTIVRCGFYDRTIDMRNNLTSNKPILVEGQTPSSSGHEWVCDGLQDIQWCTNGDNGQNFYGANTLYHMNWGWGGYNGTGYNGNTNGWYRYGDFNPTSTQHFNDKLKVIINITPNR